MPKGFIKTRQIVFCFFWALVSLAGIPTASAQEGTLNPEALILKYKPVLAPETFIAHLSWNWSDRADRRSIIKLPCGRKIRGWSGSFLKPRLPRKAKSCSRKRINIFWPSLIWEK